MDHYVAYRYINIPASFFQDFDCFLILPNIDKELFISKLKTWFKSQNVLSLKEASQLYGTCFGSALIYPLLS